MDRSTQPRSLPALKDARKNPSRKETGGGNGLLTIARGTLPLSLFGAAGYGLRTGILAAPARILQGGAPLLFGLVLDRAGPYWALTLLGTITAASFFALFLLPTTPQPAAVGVDGAAVR